MKTLAMLFCGVAAAGCTTLNNDVMVNLTASWSFETLILNTNPEPALCPAPFNDAVIAIVPIDANFNATGGGVFALVGDCTAGTATVQGVYPGLAEVFVEIHQNATRGDLGPLYARSGSVVVNIGHADVSVNVPPIATNGSPFAIEWNLVAQSNNAPVSCVKAGATGGIEVASTSVATPTSSTSTVIPCSDTMVGGKGLTFTAPLFADRYTVSVSTLNSAMQPTNTASAVIGTTTSPPNASPTQLGTINIPIAGL
jgi:hypothetical protein